jgi:glutamate--cysteine ligase
VYVRRKDQLVATYGQLLHQLDDLCFEDFRMLLSTIYTDARVRTHVELRSADAGDLPSAMALAAFWKGLMYDETSLEAAFSIAPPLDQRGYFRFAKDVSIRGLNACERDVAALPIARQLLKIAREGIARLAPGELTYLRPLEGRLNEGVTPADCLVQDCGDNVLAAIKALKIA